MVQLVGTRGNGFGIGSRVRLSAGGRTQTREVHLGSGFLSSPPPEAAFGLGDAVLIDRLEVRWPSGEIETFERLESNRIVVIEEGKGFRYATPRGQNREPEAPAPAGATGDAGGPAGAPCASSI